MEVVGIAEGANFVREEKSTDFGSEFGARRRPQPSRPAPLTRPARIHCAPDLDVYNRAITLAQGPMAKLFQPATA